VDGGHAPHSRCVCWAWPSLVSARQALDQLGQQYFLDVNRCREAPDNFRPKVNRRGGKQIHRQRDNVQIVVEMFSMPAMPGEACGAWVALAIMADATEVTSGRISEENISAKVDGLSRPHKAPARARQFSQIHHPIDYDEEIDVTRESNSEIRRTPGQTRAAPHKGIHAKK
jgi:hypothetical protein